MDLGCGSGNAAIAARLMGYNVTAIDKSPTAAALTASRLLNKYCTQLWAEAFKEILNHGAPRTAVDQAMASFVPLNEDYIPIDGNDQDTQVL